MAGFELSHQLLFESACGFPKNTNYTPAFKECLDYIFYEKDNLVVESVVPLPEEEQLSAEGGGIPSQYFPSDHLPLICDLRWKWRFYYVFKTLFYLLATCILIWGYYVFLRKIHNYINIKHTASFYMSYVYHHRLAQTKVQKYFPLYSDSWFL